MKANIIGRRILVRLGGWLLRFVYRDRAVPVSSVLFLRNLARSEAALLPQGQSIRTCGRSLHNPFLAARLADMELGTWSLAASTLNFLERQIQVVKPDAVLEFGSGVSTACLARYMQELRGDSNQPYVFSVEQDLSVAQKTVQLIEGLQLGKYARIVHFPLHHQVVEGVRTTCYDLCHDFLGTVLRDNRPDFVVIDGPAGESNARFGTIPLARPFLSSSARFFLDDALRAGELEIAQLWSRLPYVRINGVYLIGKGLLVGRLAARI